MQRLNTMVSSLVLRRTKEDLSSGTLQLTKKVVTQHRIDLKEDEMAIHQYMYTEARWAGRHSLRTHNHTLHTTLHYISNPSQFVAIVWL